MTACVIPHLFHMSQGGALSTVSRGEHFGPLRVRRTSQTIADHRHYFGPNWAHGGNLRSNSARRRARALRARDLLADAFPAEYRGSLLFNNVHGNRVNRDVLERAGSGFVGRHAPDFLLANDRWFRGINLRTGPDGAVYLIDWYDPQACHSTDVDAWNRGNGRLYRVRYGAHATNAVDLALLDDRALVDLQAHANDWYVRTARRLLQERGGSADTRRRLVDVLERSPEPAPAAARPLGPARDGQPRPGAGLRDPRTRRRGSARVGCPARVRGPRRLAGAAGALRRAGRERPIAGRAPLPGERAAAPAHGARWDIAAALAGRAEDAGDANLPLVLWYGIEPLVAQDPERALALADDAALPQVADFVHRRAAHEDAAHPALLAAIGRMADDEQRARALDQFLEGTRDRREVPLPDGWDELYPQLAQSADERVRERALALAAAFGDERVFPELRARLADPERSLDERRLALVSLQRAPRPETAAVLCELVGEESELGADVVRALARFDHEGVAPALLAAYPALDVELRQEAIGTLTARAGSARALLAAIGRGEVPREALAPSAVRQLKAFEDPALDAELERVWGLYRETSQDRAASIAAWRERLDPARLAAADLSQGRRVFGDTCQRCHALYGVGDDVAPTSRARTAPISTTCSRTSWIRARWCPTSTA